MLLNCFGALEKSPSHNLPRKHPFFIYPPPKHTPRCMNNWRVCRNMFHKFIINYYNPGQEAMMPAVTPLFTGPLDHKWPKGLQLKFLNSLKVSTSCWIAHSHRELKKNTRPKLIHMFWEKMPQISLLPSHVFYKKQIKRKSVNQMISKFYWELSLDLKLKRHRKTHCK